MYYYDVRNFHVTIYTRALRFCMVQQTIIRNEISYTLIDYKAAMQVQKILRTCQPHTIALGAATLVAYSRSMVKLNNAPT